MNIVHPKKHFGQHFLKDEQLAARICESLTLHKNYSHVLEIGPGTGVLSKYLFESKNFHTTLIEIDRDAYHFLTEKFPGQSQNIIYGDFLNFDINTRFNEPFAIIGNFPYNISTQILFRILEHRDKIPEMVGMFQKEVAQRIASPPGSKQYGILSVLLQAFYNIEYLFTVSEHVFYPPPKIKSAVIRLLRNEVKSLDCDEKLFVEIVKKAFNQRRKTLRNALKSFKNEELIFTDPIFNKRAEQLGVEEFVRLTQILDKAL
ncbi:MAG TPA: 16S rRNA (adenine(1518)-N(6)/adenine(1519)-N(6))-dimethyltransferase RsmA [Bacteroidales bacterium]|nr:16S rRNA (adenine(1518)-N(6)/adenine(1519)-N(6))-dimethyltransferase RsmA [Bacteroidales bacterium]